MTYEEAYPPQAPSEPTSVYRYYDAGNLLLYVGITSRGARRNSEHNDSKQWWKYVARQEVDHYPDRRTALIRERDLIRRHRPPFNTQHNIDAAGVRAAYIAYASAGANMTPPPLADDARRMPLEPVERDGNRLILATLPEHAGFASKIRPVVFNQVPCRVGDRQVGHVIQVDQHAVRTTITVRLKIDLGAEVIHATASLKQMHHSPPGVLRVSRVDLNGNDIPSLVYALTRGVS